MSDERTRISDIKNDNEWHNIGGTVILLYDDFPGSMAQKGVIEDDTGRIEFVLWKKSADKGVPLLEEGQDYALSGVVTNVYEGVPSISLNARTKVSRL